MHFQKLLITGIVSISVLGTINAQAATGYRRTKTANTSKKSYYSTSITGSTYKANKSTKHFVFKANHALKNYKNTTWTRTKKTTITKKGKKYLYYFVHNSKNNASGWIYSKYLQAGKNYQATSPISFKGTFIKKQNGNIYAVSGKNNYITLKKVSPISANFNYKVSAKRYIYKHGKKHLYYKVSKTKTSKSGWVWSNYIKKGTYTNVSSKKSPISTDNSSSVTGTTSNIKSNTNKPSDSSNSNSMTIDPAFTQSDLQGYEMDLIREPLNSYTKLANEKNVDISGFVNITNNLNTMFSDMSTKKVLKNQQSVNTINKLLSTYTEQVTTMENILKPFPEFNSITNIPFKQKVYLSTSFKLYSKPELNYTNYIGTAQAYDLVYFDQDEHQQTIIRDASTGQIGYAQPLYFGYQIAPTSGYNTIESYTGKFDEWPYYSIESPIDGYPKTRIPNDGTNWYQTDIKNKVNNSWVFNNGKWSITSTTP